MKKRILCFLTAAVLILLPWAAPALEEDDEDECFHQNKDYINMKEAEVNVPGYTGDYVCLDCGLVILKGEVIPALDPPVGEAMDGSLDGDGESGTGETGNTGNPDVSEDPAVPASSDPSSSSDPPVVSCYPDPFSVGIRIVD